MLAELTRKIGVTEIIACSMYCVRLESFVLTSHDRSFSLLRCEE